MATRPQAESSTAAILLRKLCSKITGLVDDAVLPHYHHALRMVSSNIASPMETDEFQVAERIKRRLVKQGREKDAAIFSELHRKLQAQTVLRRRWAILHMMFSLSEDTSRSKVQFENSLFGRSLPSYSYATSTPYHGPAPGRLPEGSTLQSVNQSSESSGISSIHRSQGSNDPTPIPQSFMPSMAVTPGGGMITDSTAGTRSGLGLRIASLSQYHQIASESAMVPQGWRSAQTARARTTVHRGDNTSFEIPESEMICDLVYIFQGIEAKWIKFDNTKDGYRIDADAGIPKSWRQLVSKLAELGWLYNKTMRYVAARSADKAFGLVGQGFCAALHQELTEYFRLIAVLEAQLHQEQDQGVSMSDGGMTLIRLLVWTFDPLVRLKALAALVDVCKGKKGGALCSAIHSYMQHGDPYVRSLVKHILTMVAQPVYVTLIRWAFDGELEDTYHEFFVASDPTVKDDRLWVDKYSTRKSMIPTFISADQARKFLLTGKSINFLRQVCQDRTPIKGREVAMEMDMSQGAESMFSQDVNSVFQQMIDCVYKETSQHLLRILHNKYKFLDHLKAMRRYLLLGQGDFIRHLMDLLEEDLAKPAGNLYLHNLTGILETAIRATNAQFDDSDILKRLDVRLLEVSPGDTGWDVFSLDYHVDGPIRTVFTPECMIMYLRVFNFLWRAKRMEYILAMIWKNQMSMDRVIRQIPELLGVKHQCHILASEMLHFIQQVQYYINFEVLECSWDELLTKVQEAEDLDYIIAAHEVFLDAINARCLLVAESRAILTQLRTIFDLIIQFQAAQNRFYNAVEHEVNARQHFTTQLQRKTADGNWGMTEEDERVEEHRKTNFCKSLIPSTRPQLQVLATSYRDMVQEFIVMVTRHQDASLRFLSFRLDFNEHYKSREPKLRSPLIYQRHKQRVT